MSPKWRLRPHDRARIEALSLSSGVPPLVAQLLLNRGITGAAEAREFLESRQKSLHDPATLPGVVEAAGRIVAAIRAGRKIVVYGDYDVDGVCGTSILWTCLKLAGAKDPEYYIPHRVDEGYGVNAEALRMLATERGATLIITVDCGISAMREAELARELGVELIVTDHHTIGPELPAADVVVHPRRSGGSYPFGDLCGCGVAFKLAWQVCKTFGDGKKASPHLRDFLVRSLHLVALATVADMVPMAGENRIFVRHGLAGLFQSPSAGLKALLGVSGLLDKRALNSGNVGFNLAPRINAAGRMSRAMQAVEMLTTDDEGLAQSLAEELDRCNGERQTLERTTVDEAHQMIAAAGGADGRGALVVGRVGWHPGVIGIVAGRLAETYHRPTVVVAIAGDSGQGSCRSIAGFDLYGALHACSEGLTSFGGHKAAAGLRIPAAGLAAFAERFDQHCRGALTAEQLTRELVIDAEVRLADLSVKVVEAIDEMEPYGIGNPKPVLMAEGVRVAADPRIVGDRKNHVQFRFAQGNATLKGIAWNFSERARAMPTGTLGSLAFTPSINEWNGRREVQLEVKDFQAVGDDAHARTA